MKYDVVVIGAGIIGSLIADDLAKYDLNIAVIEKESDGGLEQSMSSSAIVHSGIDPKEGTLKAKYNVLGNKLMAEKCASLNVEYLQCGGYIVAEDETGLEHLKKMKEQGMSRGIDCTIISKEQLNEFEPNINPDIKYALSMPTTGVIYPTELTIAALERAMINGVQVYYETRVQDINYENDTYTICCNNLEIEAKYVINSAGMYSDEIAKMTDPDLMVTNVPKRGEYFVTNNINPVVNSVIYPVPTANGKGVLAVPTTHGNVLLGPNGVIQEDKEDDSTHTEDLSFVQKNVDRILNQFPRDIIKTYAGLRSSGNNGDFYIEACHKTSNMINLIAIDSPGIASSPAISNEVCSRIVALANATPKEEYVEFRSPYLDLKKLPLDQQNAIISNEPKFGKIICRCEQVSEGEIRAAIRKENGARDLTGIKFRIRPMLGMCQGGFCETEVVRILADELGVPITSIKRRGHNTLILKGGNDE
ncbi:NAD(P)/FAD-dependent oxidoreductase [Mollicutes bacterium LVI A0078]|nr:NAD(P)/FAD-dependent oxidoreductase [Mollicutes bacterium LVI A0075]WOO91366.1 NAD(P)/FAD-dependent oxidoreductase [Mollicutes bacterium LVI A0078]